MCEFCSQHGEGKTWYLNAKNYSSDLVHDLKRRDFIGHFYQRVIGDGNRDITLLEKTLLRKMNLPSFVREKLSRNMKVMHYGQVLPLEDVDRILAMARTVTRVACGCKWAKEKKEGRLCYGITMGPPAWTDLLDMDFFGSPELARLENLSRDEASCRHPPSGPAGLHPLHLDLRHPLHRRHLQLREKLLPGHALDPQPQGCPACSAPNTSPPSTPPPVRAAAPAWSAARSTPSNSMTGTMSA